MSASFAEPGSWLSRIRLLNDAPIGRRNTRDRLGFTDQVKLVVFSSTHARGPMVIHVDGAWGRGKTSFCRLLETAIRDLSEGDQTGARGRGEGPIRDIRSSWFVASDDRAGLADSLLHAIAAAVTDHDAEESARVLRTWGSANGEDDVSSVTRRAQRRARLSRGADGQRRPDPRSAAGGPLGRAGGEDAEATPRRPASQRARQASHATRQEEHRRAPLRSSEHPRR